MKPNRYIRPVPGKYQRRARLRRLRQALRDGHVFVGSYDEAVARVEADYESWRKL